MRSTLPFVICDVTKLNTAEGFIKLPYEAHADPHSYTCSTKALKHWASKAASGLRLDALDIHSPEDGATQGRNAAEQGELRWFYARRDISDRTSQPQPAPSGVDAQKAANFQRFYRAVVSPNHVRVTAGGRIIPNNLVHPHAAMPIMNNGRFVYPVRVAGSTGNYNHFVATSDQLAAALNLRTPDLLGDQSAADDDPVPWMNGAKIPASSNSAPVELTAQRTEPQQPQASHERSTDENNHGIEISPPDTFDRTRPFLYNGHTHYPLPSMFPLTQNMSMLPITLFSTPQAGHNILSAAARMPPMPVVFYPAMPPATTPVSVQQPLLINPGQPLNAVDRSTHFPFAMANGPQLQNLNYLPNNSTALFPVGNTVAQAVMIRTQIQSLEQHRQHLDNQLNNNKHQIDEQRIAQERATVQNQIESLQSALPQLMQQGSTVTESQAAIPQLVSGTGPLWSVPQPAPTSIQEVESNTSQSVGPDKHPTEVLENGRKNLSGTAKVEESKRAKISRDSGLSRRSRLSAAAAKAPPFQPRSQQVVAAVPTLESEEKSIPNANPNINNEAIISPPSRSTNEIIFTPNAGGILTPLHLGTQELPPQPFMFPAPLQRNWSIPNIGLDGASMDAVSELHRFDSFTPHIPGVASIATAAYLRGTVPQGMDPSRAKSEDMIYPRPLTEEEIRARYLYWGKAPREATRGLPKFDGQHFYPPSPIKKIVPITETVLTRSSINFGLKSPERDMRKSSSVKSRSEDTPRSSGTGDPFQDSGLRGSKAHTPKKPTASEASSVDSWGASKLSSIETSLLQAPKAISAGLNSPSKKQAQPSFLQGMLRKSRSAGLPIPLHSELSSATAQGFLPQFEGSAIASLTPSKKLRPAPSPTRLALSSSKLSMIENRPPFQSRFSNGEHLSAAQMLRKIKSHETALSPNRPAGGKPTGERQVGPIMGDEW